MPIATGPDPGAILDMEGFPDELAARGVSSLMVDCPGSGEALRFLGLTARVETCQSPPAVAS